MINNKYLMASNELQIRIEEAYKLDITNDFNPIKNILNLGNLQYAFSYYICQAIFVDLSSDYGDSKGFFNQRSVYFEDTYKSNIKSALSSLIIDKDKNNIADVEERKESKGIISFKR